jgi:multiple sugar transport system substrate-binding protein
MKQVKLTLIFIVLCAIMLSSCAPTATQTAEVSSPTQQATTEVQQTSTENQGTTSFDWQKYAGESIIVLNAEMPITDVLQKYVPEFEKLTGINVDYQVQTEEQMREKVMIALQAGSNEFDVYEALSSREGPMFIQGGWSEPLDDYIEKQLPPDYDFEGIGKGPISGMQYNGKTYGLPIYIEGAVLYYRTDLFDEYNIPVPTTVADIEKAAETLKPLLPEGVYPISLFGTAMSLFFCYSPIIHGYSPGYVVDGEPAFSTEGGMESLRVYSTLAAEYGPPGVVNNAFPQTVSLFMSGNAAMMINSSDQTMNINDPNQSNVVGKVGEIVMPPGPYGDHPTVHSYDIAMNPNSSHKDAAWYYIAWATSKAMQDKMQLEGIPSPRPSSWTQQAWLDMLSTPLLQQFTDAMSHMIAVGQGNIGPEGVIDQPGVRQTVGTIIDKIILGEVTVEEGAKEADDALKTFLK